MFRNNWITTNIKERATRPTPDFTAQIHAKNIRGMSFADAADYTARTIAADFDKPIYVSFSGGMDSEYVVRTFHRNGIPFTPIIVECNDNGSERRIAYDVCNELGLTPKILVMSDKELMSIIYYDIIKNLNSVGIYSAPHIFASYHITLDVGVLVCGAEMLDTEGLIRETKIGINDWDIYPSGLPINSISIPFFYYTPEIFLAYVNSIDDNSTDTIQEFKSKLYGVKLRPKLRATYNARYLDMLNKYIHDNKTRSRYFYIFGDKNSVAESDGKTLP